MVELKSSVNRIFSFFPGGGGEVKAFYYINPQRASYGLIHPVLKRVVLEQTFD